MRMSLTSRALSSNIHCICLCNCGTSTTSHNPTMAMRVANRRALGSALSATRNAFIRRSESNTSIRAFTSSQAARVVVSPDTPNLRHAQRDPDPPGGLHRAPVNPADKYAVKADEMHRYGSWLMGCLPKYIQQFSVWKDELVIYISPSGVIPVFSFLKYNTSAEFTQVSDITAVDFPTRDQRFEVVYNMLSVRHNSRIRVKTYADEASPVPSITSLYDGANWYEREVYDLFGVFFIGHPDLRRIMTDYGFDGHPLRKDFPLSGYTEIRYDEEKKRIVVEPLELTQAFRNFEGGSAAWEQVGAGVERKPESFKLPTPKPEEKKEEPKK
ncbi:NADH-ubiquinone oxidoreductase 30.4 kDa subunit, mitochondrial [Lachnellula willkommii]|uniref:NADH-ubiquinone oxidoreductase 30.4 kDa subunit, mitochondrial n=1 Tax=Lachnellula willkommii TaxID=215461 RepID=A0A559MNC6_9HELO|nr:NADH-ubiquinone oxidoreductase 30.4 kDa subunit, mitochondrial [Lachnellula willkommii]